MLANEREYQRMAEAEDKHWWYYALHERVYESIRKNFPSDKEVSILDAGCGTGGMMDYLQGKGYKNIKGFDVSEYAVSACKKKNLNVFQSSLTEMTGHFDQESFDIIICCDVLYFLSFENQKKIIADFYNLTKSNGVIILNVPALKLFQGIHDLSVGIQKRFNHTSFIDELLPEYAKKYSFRYWPVLLSPFIAIIRFFQRKKIKAGKYIIKSDIAIPPYIINHLLKGLMKLEMNYLPPLNFGSSLFIEIIK